MLTRHLILLFDWNLCTNTIARNPVLFVQGRAMSENEIGQDEGARVKVDTELRFRVEMHRVFCALSCWWERRSMSLPSWPIIVCSQVFVLPRGPDMYEIFPHGLADRKPVAVEVSPEAALLATPLCPGRSRGRRRRGC